MHSAAIQGSTVHAQAEKAPRWERLRHLIEHATHLLPAQGPIKVFIHHNTLHAFEDLPFEEAVRVGGGVFGCSPFLSEEKYRQAMRAGRIRREDVAAVLHDDLGVEADRLIGLFGTRFQLRQAMLRYSIPIAPGGELRWFVAETDALRKFRDDAPHHLKNQVIEETRHWVMRDLREGVRVSKDPAERRIRQDMDGLFDRFDRSAMERWSAADWESLSLHALWCSCRQGVEGVPDFSSPPPMPIRHRDLMIQICGVDSDELVHGILIPFCGTYLDQGMASWSIPGREQGFFQAFLSLYRLPGGPPDPWLRPLRRELARIEDLNYSPLESIDESLEMLGVRESDHEAYISASLLALRGWAGMLWQIESRADRAVNPAPSGSLIGFLAIRLILDRIALAYLARSTLGYDGPLDRLSSILRGRWPKPMIDVDQRAFVLFQLAQVLGWKPAELFRLPKATWKVLVQEVEAFGEIERRRIFHLAYERRYQIQTLDAIHVRASLPVAKAPRPDYQVVYCIDEREESFRRHLEEIDPKAETFGTAGFFGVAMYYRGAADAHYVPLCPVVIVAQHYVQETVSPRAEELHRRRGAIRRWIGTLVHRFHVSSRTGAGGAMLTGFFGPLASVPLVFRVLFPRLTAQIRRMAGRIVQPPDATDLLLERRESVPGSQEGHIGYTVDEMAGIVERLLRDIGLTREFSPLILIVGHGSSSLNNPHESAHDCGACGGNRGGPNARAFVRMANDARVRKILVERGLPISNNTIFVAAYHNTCDDAMVYFDLDGVPASHLRVFQQAYRSLDLARKYNAHERCRRFESASLKLSPEQALQHVEGRAEDLSQVRPEYGHATNSICIVARRSRTRGLYCDRRAFLTSYDPTQDDENSSILTRILQAVVPVCAGINLEYYFSFVDPTGYGCGTKLPHNITSLLGVMDGPASDMRPGLPWQMIEIHEPVRLQIILETTPEAALRILDRNPSIARFCRNQWVRLATLDPQSSAIHVFENDRFERYRPETVDLPQVDASSSWYRGWRDHLGFALVQDAASDEQPSTSNGEASK